MQKSESRIFEKKSRFGDIREKVSKLAQNQILIFFSKTDLRMFLVFGQKVVLNMNFNLSETYFFRKICNLEIVDLEIVKKLPKLRFLAIFSTLHHWFFLILHIMIGGHDVQLFSYNSPVQSVLVTDVLLKKSDDIFSRFGVQKMTLSKKT